VELILWRHCDAESGMPDELRRLTPRGRNEAQRMAKWLSLRLPADCRIRVSPAVRAQQTAQALNRPFETDARLATGASVADVLDVAQWPHADTATLIVGHEPTLGLVVAELLAAAGTERPLAKGAVVWLVSGIPETAGAIVKAAVDPGSVA
jgi:phosphohistidine phosphatase